MEFLDSNWLTAILGAAVSAYIFLMGLPSLFFQTFLPEEQREILSKRKLNTNTLLNLTKISWFLFLFIVVLLVGNITIPWFWKADSEYIYKRIVVGYYLSTVALFVVFIKAGLKYVRNQLESNPSKLIIEGLVEETWKKYYEFGHLDNQDINDLQTLSKSLPAGLKKSDLLKHLDTLSRNIIACKKNSYHGDKFPALIGDVLKDGFCYTNESCSETNLQEIMSISENILNAYLTSSKRNMFGEVDRDKLSELIPKIMLNALDNNFDRVAENGWDLVKKIPENDPIIYKLCIRYFKIGNYAHVLLEAKEIVKDIKNQEDSSRKHYALAYLSWFFCGNNQMKGVAKDKIDELLKLKCLKYDDFVNAILQFRNKADFDTANTISRMKNELFEDEARFVEYITGLA
jgi:hypothetical protein